MEITTQNIHLYLKTESLVCLMQFCFENKIEYNNHLLNRVSLHWYRGEDSYVEEMILDDGLPTKQIVWTTDYKKPEFKINLGDYSKILLPK